MLGKPIVLLSLPLAALFAVALLLAAPSARAETALPGANSPSVVMGAFKQGQVAAGSNRAALVVRYGDGGVQTRCVQFEEDEIGGDELLDRSGLAPVFGFNLEVCSINGQGCPSDDCFCQCPFPNCEYWAYYHLTNGAWDYSEVGASGSGVKNGDVEGWSWGPGDFSQGTPPPLMTFDQICNPQSQATATPTATATQQGGALAIAFFTAQPTTLQPPACATLSWQTSNAATVLLEGAPVAAQGTQTVCPTNTQTYSLIAASATGQQVTAQVTVQVTTAQGGTGQATLTPTATPAAASATPAWSPTAENVARSGMPTPAYVTPFPQDSGVQPPGFIPQPGQAIGAPSPAPNLSPLAPGQLVGGVPLAPTAEPVIVEQFPQAPQGPVPTATRFVFARPPTETPRPRRILGADGRPTPTPILVARAGGAGSGGAASTTMDSASGATGGSGPLMASRAFSQDLLPQYAGYLATLTLLLAVGWLVHRRRSAQPLAVAQPARDAEPSRSDRLASGDERAQQ